MDGQITMRDAYSRYTTKTFGAVGTTLAEVQADLAALAADFDAVSLSATVKTRVSAEELISSVPQAGANNDAGATLHCRLDNGKLYPLKIPAISPSLLNSDGSVKVEETAIAALVAHFADGGEFTVSEGNTIAAVEYGELDR